MQVKVVEGGDLAARALLYKQPTEQIMNYVNAGLNKLKEYGNTLSEGFKNAINTVYNQYWSDGVLDATNWLINNIGSTKQDVIYPVQYETFNTANLLMQRYIMAYPELNILAKRNMCNGFQDTYFNIEPETYGEERYEYQRVMDGILQYDKDEVPYVKYYSNSDNVELTLPEKLSVLETWNNVARLIAEGKDPSDPLLNDL